MKKTLFSTVQITWLKFLNISLLQWYRTQFLIFLDNSHWMQTFTNRFNSLCVVLVDHSALAVHSWRKVFSWGISSPNSWHCSHVVSANCSSSCFSNNWLQFLYCSLYWNVHLLLSRYYIINNGIEKKPGKSCVICGNC